MAGLWSPVPGGRSAIASPVAFPVFHQTKQKATWPKLAEVARHLLAGPAASTLSERSFSIAGRTIEDRRTQLSAEFVDGLMFLHRLAE